MPTFEIWAIFHSFCLTIALPFWRKNRIFRMGHFSLILPYYSLTILTKKWPVLRMGQFSLILPYYSLTILTEKIEFWEWAIFHSFCLTIALPFWRKIAFSDWAIFHSFCLTIALPFWRKIRVLRMGWFFTHFALL